jgi:hypothetical protein
MVLKCGVRMIHIVQNTFSPTSRESQYIEQHHLTGSGDAIELKNIISPSLLNAALWFVLADNERKNR